MKVKGFLATLAFLFLFSLSTQAAGCPEAAKVEAALKKAFPRAKNLKVEKISPSKSVKGFCEAVVSVGGPFKNVIYVDKSGEFALLGQLIDLKTGENLTRKKVTELSKLKPEQIKKLEKLVAFTVGKGPKTVYLVTDPDCPFCKRLEATLDEFIKEGKLTVKVILFPLERLHPKAKEKCVAIICDHKGWDELRAGYTSENQCEEGKKKVKEAQEYLFSLGIRGTPGLILPDGRIIRGALPKDRLAKTLGL